MEADHTARGGTRSHHFPGSSNLVIDVMFGAGLGIKAQEGIGIRKPVLPKMDAVSQEDVGPCWK